MTNNLGVSSFITPLVQSYICDNTKEPKVSMPEKFDDTWFYYASTALFAYAFFPLSQ